MTAFPKDCTACVQDLWRYVRGSIVRVMRLVLHGQSSFAHWLTASSCTPYEERSGKQVLKDCEPVPESVSFLEGLFPYLPQPYHVTVLERNKAPLPEAVSHISVYRYSPRIFCKIESGVYASCPELCLTQLASSLTLHELILAASVLCGIYRRNPLDGALEKRLPLTTRAKILAFLQRNPRIHGSKKVREAVRWVTEKAASPPEAVLAMMLRLPFRLGGFQLEGFKVNCRIEPSRRARAIAGRSTLVPDILFSEARLALEYDSTAEHTSAQQLTLDAKKRSALEADGYKVVTVTARQMQNAEEMRKVALQVYKRLGLRFRPRCSDFGERQQAVIGVGRMLDRFFRDCERGEAVQRCSECASR